MDAKATARYIVREFRGYEPADVIATVAAALTEAYAAGRRAGLGEAAEVAQAKIRFYEQADWHVNGATAAASVAQDIEDLKEGTHV
jgi:hypothetical protein